jgi:hypothetical protein
MRMNQLASLVIALVLTTSYAIAIDRNASMVDTVRIDATSYDHADSVLVRVTGETAVEDTGGMWAILAGIGAGSFDPKNNGDYDTLAIELGVRNYLTRLTSISILGGYTWLDGPTDLEVGTITLSAKQRLQAPSEPVSPFIRLNASLQFVDDVDSYDVLVLSASAGCDFAMSKDMALVFEGGISESEDIDDGTDRADGWQASVAMRYYWE